MNVQMTVQSHESELPRSFGQCTIGSAYLVRDVVTNSEAVTVVVQNEGSDTPFGLDHYRVLIMVDGYDLSVSTLPAADKRYKVLRELPDAELTFEA
jgi:hypothetical protein